MFGFNGIWRALKRKCKKLRLKKETLFKLIKGLIFAARMIYSLLKAISGDDS
jgi:hypothetical protein